MAAELCYGLVLKLEVQLKTRLRMFLQIRRKFVGPFEKLMCGTCSGCIKYSWPNGINNWNTRSTVVSLS